MRIPSTFRDRRASVELQLTPMIDCVFLLMVYFLWSSNFKVAEMSLPSKLAASAIRSGAGTNDQPTPEADFPNVVVRILRTDGRPAWTVNDSPMGSLDELRTTLSTIARIKADAPVVLDPSSDVPLGEVIGVFDLSRLVGFEKIQFATSVID